MKSEKYITGIQQIGVGVENAEMAFKWYRKNFGMDIVAFDEKATAKLMLHYTQGKTCERHAILALNFQGGGGFEIWQHTGKAPEKIHEECYLGDLGIHIVKMKTANVKLAFNDFKAKGINIISEIKETPNQIPFFFVKDAFDNIFQFIEEAEIYEKTKFSSGGVFGAIIGVSNIETALNVYGKLLNYDKIIYDSTDIFEDFNSLKGGKRKFRRVLLTHSKTRHGSFSKFYGATQIELIQLLEGNASRIYENRVWGDPGFIHICFDVIGIKNLKQESESLGFPFTVDSANSFDMGDAAGHFAYISDPDGTPLEFVETHKVPIIKKWGLFINLKGRDPQNSIPRWMINTLKWKRVKE
ncbi:MAG: glyoxalase [Bacteroidetes bacterium CG2_30_33_31]|nr:MAG: glyoxalase [Bacteroidetes bacterium CG2_30_33_31]